MSYLIEKTTLTIEPKLAVLIGLNESIFIKQLHYWLSKTKHRRDGEKWVFNTIPQWREQLPFFSEKTIKRIILNLKTENWIKVVQYDKNKMNRTNWYTINYQKITEIQEKVNPNEQTLENKKIENPKKIAKKKSNEGAESSYSDEFLEFWNSYPKKYGKRMALISFEKLSKEEKITSIFGAKQYSFKTENTEEKYIKTAKRWIDDRFFEDYESHKSEKVELESNYIDILAEKVAAILEVEVPNNTPFWSQMRGVNFYFNEKEQTDLENLKHNLDFYKEIEFQKGEIKAYLKGVLL